MASSTYTPACLCSSTRRRITIFNFSSSVVLCPKSPNSRLLASVPQLGLSLCTLWNGLRHLGISIRQKSVKIERRGRSRSKVVYASLFGVGAPEALVIGVVALLVFGPKGLAEVARNLGKTLRAFQPTIRELQEVSREFKSTLEREIGLDEISPSAQNTYNSSTTTMSSSANNENSEAMVDPNATPRAKKPYSSEEYLKITKEQLKSYVEQQQTLRPEDQSESESQPQGDDSSLNKPLNIGEFFVEAQIKASTSQQQEQKPPQGGQSEPQSQLQAVAPELATSMSPSKKPESDTRDLSSKSMQGKQ